MTNLPTRGSANSMDDLGVTRELFRQGQGNFLEYVAQALGGVAGAYGNETVDPLNVILQSSTVSSAGAKLTGNPPASSNDLRIPTTSWVRQNVAPITNANNFIIAGASIKIGVAWGRAQYRNQGGGQNVLSVNYGISFAALPTVVVSAIYGPNNGMWNAMVTNLGLSSFGTYVVHHATNGSDVPDQNHDVDVPWIAIGQMP